LKTTAFEGKLTFGGPLLDSGVVVQEMPEKGVIAPLSDRSAINTALPVVVERRRRGVIFSGGAFYNNG
jgi:hypothetical protein